MQNIAGYRIIQKIYQGPKTVLYRAVNSRDDSPVILKMLLAAYPTPQDIARLKHEYEMARQLNLPDMLVSPCAWIEHDNRPLVVLEDFGGVSLAECIPPHGMPFSSFFPLAERLCQIVDQLHHRQVIHKDIKPRNVIVGPDFGIVKLTGLGIASSAFGDQSEQPSLIEGTFSYIAPEQTGRINRGIDQRSDLYALGVTFYEMLVGAVPFRASDPVELIHCHLTQLPPSPQELRAEIPLPLTLLVLKLLAKNPDHRYQSATGIQADIAECRRQWQQNGRVDMPLGRHDVPVRLPLPGKLYGREEALRLLHEAVARVYAGGREMVLVTGGAGIGKSALLEQLRDSVVVSGGYFLSGKFDLLAGGNPYATVNQAFGGLVRQLLTQSPERVARWREKILQALGHNGQVMIDIIPELELIIGKQPAVPPLPPQESQHRFLGTSHKFVQVFAQKEHPLIVFLDDWQWGNYANLKIGATLLADAQTSHLLLLGAYRDNEIGEEHAVAKVLEDMRQMNNRWMTIRLEPLTYKAIDTLLRDCLGDNDRLDSLRQLLLRKTEGNPFFVHQFLATLCGENAISFDAQAGKWRWDLAQIEAMNITDNVAELMANRLKRLPLATQQILATAACCGNSFDVATIARLQGEPMERVLSKLDETRRQGFVLNEMFSPSAGEKIRFRFLHDRVQQAAYSLLADDQRERIHLQLGRLLWQLPHAQEEMLFTMVDHLNLGSRHIHGDKEREDMARLNLRAAQRSRLTNAYTQAAGYARSGIAMLSDNAWQQQHTLAFELHMELLESEHCDGREQSADNAAEELLAHVQNNLEQAQIYSKRAILVQAGHPLVSLKYAIAGLRFLGIRLSHSVNPVTILWELAKLKWLLRKRTVADIASLPHIANPTVEIAMSLLLDMTPCAFMTENKALFALSTFKVLNMSLQYGHSNGSSMAYATYGMFLTDSFRLQKACEFGELAIQLSKQFDDDRFSYYCQHVWGSFLRHWRHHCAGDLEILADASRLAAEKSFSYAHHSDWLGLWKMLVIGSPLPVIVLQMTELQKKISTDWRRNQHDLAEIIEALTLFEWLVMRLRWPRKDNLAYPHDSEIPASSNQWPRNQAVAAAFAVQLFYLTGKFNAAAMMAKYVESSINFFFATIFLPEFYFYDSLISASLYAETKGRQRRRHWKKLVANQRKMKTWADNCPANFAHKYLLVAAEMERLRGHIVPAMRLYDQAIVSAHDNRYIQNEALANELAARFFLSLQSENVARVYMREARFLYRQWGAMAKVKQLEDNYAALLANDAPIVLTADHAARTSFTTVGNPAGLDLFSLLKASQAISGEIVLARLLSRLMRIMAENLGAQRGFLIMEKNGRLDIESEYPPPPNKENASVSQRQDLAQAVIYYVRQAAQHVVIHEAVSDATFGSDGYIRRQRPKSILCAPIRKGSDVTGIAYFENNMTTHAFTAERLQILDILTAQATISLENARLYEELQYLHQQIMEISEREQRRIGQELHDGIGQHLTGVAFMSKSLQAKLAGKGMAEAAEMKEIVDFINQGIEQVRGLARGLSLIKLEELGLAMALEDLAAQTRKAFHIDCRFHHQGPSPTLTSHTALHIYRIAQEAVNNAIKHGQAGEIVIALVQKGDNNVLSVEDNGSGFSPASPPTDGIGIKSMEYRARIVGGGLEIRHKQGGGSIVTCEFPASDFS